MKRRSFIQSSSLISLPMLLNGMPLAAVGRNPFFDTFGDDNDHVLVLIQLNGGNDGLQTIIPLDRYDLLANVRSNIIVPSNLILPVTENSGFHPSMTGMKNLYDDALMTVVQDVGYPNQNRSHFRSTDIWTSGSPADEFWTTGWLGRYFENRHPEFPENYPNSEYPDPLALSIGSIVSETCQGTISNFSLALTDPLGISTLSSGGESEVPDTPYGRELQFLRTSVEQANAYGSTITEAAEKGSNLSDLYEDGVGLAQQLKSIALLISGGLKTKVYIANIGGFDTHANQVDGGNPETGNHATLLQNLSNAIFAFQDDLKKSGLEERVISMTFSEFGRRIRSNDSLGTDHGTAAPLMVFGSCINPGFLGNSPEIPESPSQGDGVPMQFDFRNVYGSILIDWFGVEESEVKSILFPEFSYLPIVQVCDSTTPTDDSAYENEIETSIYPNPFDQWTTISFKSKGEQIRISLFDSIGNEIDILANDFFSSGSHQVKYDGNHLASGNYFYRIYSPSGLKTTSFIKI